MLSNLRNRRRHAQSGIANLILLNVKNVAKLLALKNKSNIHAKTWMLQTQTSVMLVVRLVLPKSCVNPMGTTNCLFRAFSFSLTGGRKAPIFYVSIRHLVSQGRILGKAPSLGFAECPRAFASKRMALQNRSGHITQNSSLMRRNLAIYKSLMI